MTREKTICQAMSQNCCLFLERIVAADPDNGRLSTARDLARLGSCDAQRRRDHNGADNSKHPAHDNDNRYNNGIDNTINDRGDT